MCRLDSSHRAYSYFSSCPWALGGAVLSSDVFGGAADSCGSFSVLTAFSFPFPFVDSFSGFAVPLGTARANELTRVLFLSIAGLVVGSVPLDVVPSPLPLFFLIPAGMFLPRTEAALVHEMRSDSDCFSLNSLLGNRGHDENVASRTLVRLRPASRHRSVCTGRLKN
ncbi:hypothetical protein BDZ91DRAFT_522894 [Kalaharituber pfeilii]|nr:hypothetical protein BDZ91DRAFT_522894 [Kalaharituber pfeilii]